jgi:hypothetical protein
VDEYIFGIGIAVAVLWFEQEQAWFEAWLFAFTEPVELEFLGG